MAWHFFEKTPKTKAREAMQGEFFSDGTIGSQTQALVRETVQNTLDARLDKASKAIVRFQISSAEESLSSEKSKKYFDENAISHFMAHGNGLMEKPAFDMPMNYLLIEDFLTTGLFGDYEQWDFDPEVDEKNAFYYFMRAEGLSGKSDDDKGRWGIGKFVIPKSSKIRSFFAYTVREDGVRLLAGQSILKSHHLDGTPFTPDSWFGTIEEATELGLPITEDSALDEFVSDFGISRGPAETGLSLIIPFVHEDITDLELFRAVVKDYFLPILRGELEVEISSGSNKKVLNAETILKELEDSNADMRNEKSYAELGLWGAQLPEDSYVKLSGPDVSKYKPKWSPDMITEDQKKQIKHLLSVGERVAIIVPLVVKKADGTELPSKFKILMESDSDCDGKPLFIREGIVITDVRSRKMNSTRSLVLIEQGALATLLGDAENPAHTQWQHDGGNFKGRYKTGKSYLDFVRWSVSELSKLIYSDNEGQDLDLLQDFFSVPVEDDTPKKKQKKSKKKGQKADPPDIDIHTKPKAYELAKVPNGFIIKGRKDAVKCQRLITVKVAYDCDKGSPFKLHKNLPPDFDLTSKKSGINILVNGADLVSSDINKIEVLAQDNEYSIKLEGFDANRDLVVKPRVMELEDA